jgi:cytochrome c-type biogenesis protein CcmH
MGGPTAVDWVPPLAILTVGLVLGLVLVLRLRVAARTAPALAGAPGSALPVELRDLEGQRDALFRQLRELEDTAAKRTAEQLALERYDLELRAARVLLDLEQRGAAFDKKAARAAASAKSAKAGETAIAGAGEAVPPEVLARRLAMRGFLWGAVTVGVLGLVVYLVVESAKPREAGGSVTGDTGMGRGGANAAPAESQPHAAEEAQIKDHLAKNPDDFDARIALARVYLGRQDMMGVWNETKYVLDRSPGEPRALSYQALVRVAMGQPEQAVTMLKQALATAPDLLDAYMHLALVYMRLGRQKEAAATIDEAVRRFPQDAASLRRLFEEMKTASRQEEARPAEEAANLEGEGDPHAKVGGPAAPPRASQAPRAAGGRTISGTVELDPSGQGAMTPQAVLFVFVREAGFGAGPPVAVRRIASPQFPVRFEIGEADAMMGQPFPNELLVEARLDGDGDPTTRPPTDPKARVDDVKVGRTDVRLVLKR